MSTGVLGPAGWPEAAKETSQNVLKIEKLKKILTSNPS
jgi:hypothetical protein